MLTDEREPVSGKSRFDGSLTGNSPFGALRASDIAPEISVLAGNCAEFPVWINGNFGYPPGAVTGAAWVRGVRPARHRRVLVDGVGMPARSLEPNAAAHHFGDGAVRSSGSARLQQLDARAPGMDADRAWTSCAATRPRRRRRFWTRISWSKRSRRGPRPRAAISTPRPRITILRHGRG